MMGYQTPNIDRIANEGMLCTDCYGEQSYTAGRLAFITGQSVFRTGLSKVGLPGADLGMRAEDPTSAEMLKPLGYSTSQFGKNHKIEGKVPRANLYRRTAFSLSTKLLLNDLYQCYDAQQSARLNTGFLTHMDMMRKIEEVWKMFHVIPSPPQHVLRSVHPLVTIAPGHTPSCLDDKVLRHLQKVIVTERQPCSEVSSVRQETFFDDDDCGYSGAGDQLGLDVSHVLLRLHHNDSASRPSRRSRTDCHIS